MKMSLKMILSPAMVLSLLASNYAYSAGESACFKPQVDSKTYKPGDKIRIKIPLGKKDPRSQGLNEATHAQVAFRGTRISNLATLKYNADDNSMEGEIVVPKELRSDWSLDIGLERQMGPHASDVVLLRMSSKQDFERPKVNVPEEKSATPEIKMGKVDVVKTPIDPAVLKAARKDVKFVSDYKIKGSFTVKYTGELKRKFDGKGIYSDGVDVNIKGHYGRKEKVCVPKGDVLNCTFEYSLDQATSGDEVLTITAGDYLDRKELKSGKDFRLNIPSNVVASATRREIDSMAVTKTIDGKLKVEAKVKGGVNRDMTHARLQAYIDDKDKYGKNYSLGELECKADGNCVGVFEMPKFQLDPKRFEVFAETEQFQFKKQYDEKKVPVPASVFKSAQRNEPIERSGGYSTTGYMTPKEICGVVGGVQVGNLDGSSAGAGAQKPRPAAGAPK